MTIDFLIQTFEKNRNKEAIIWYDESYSYQWLIEHIQFWCDEIASLRITKGKIVALKGDFSPECIALLLALTQTKCIIIPMMNTLPPNQQTKFFDIAKVEYVFEVNEKDEVQHHSLPQTSDYQFFQKLREENAPGLILFSSGSAGEPKAAVHNFSVLLEKFKTPRISLKILNFLLFDHWGGLNTMFHALSNGGSVITTKDRSPDNICAVVEKYKIEVLPASPTFLNLLLLSEAYKRNDISSLKIISYGTEPMLESTLKQITYLYPNVRLQQTYGLTEVGVLRTKSKNSESLWVKIGGEGYQWRVVDGILEIKAKSAMLGYLNAPSPFTQDGWFHTGDAVEVSGEYLKILGRKSEIINVGGEKVYPTEIENVIQKMDNVAEVTVYRESNPFTGNIVCAKIRLIQEENSKRFIRNLKKYCHKRLAKYKVPVKIILSHESHTSTRLKKIRNNLI